MMAVDQTLVIQPETILDFIDGVTQRRDTPEERVRQEILKSLVREYGYKKDQIAVEYSIKFGSNRKAVDVAIWHPGKEHSQENIYIIVECKDPKTKSKGKKDGVDQMDSYAAACMNCQYGMWTNGDELLAHRYVLNEKGDRVPDAVPDLPQGFKPSLKCQSPYCASKLLRNKLFSCAAVSGLTALVPFLALPVSFTKPAAVVTFCTR